MTVSIVTPGAFVHAFSSAETQTLKTTQAQSRAVEQSLDQATMERLRCGDKEALGLLYDRYCRTVLSVGLRILRDRSEAQELVQDVFLYIYKKCASFDSNK